MLNSYNWTWTPLHYTDAISWMTIFHLVFNENGFSVPFGTIRNHSHDIILHVPFDWHHKWHYEKWEHVIVMITWSWSADNGRKTISGLNHIMKHQLQIMLLIRLYFYMSVLHDIPYPEPVVFQWQSSGNPVCLELRPQCTLECHWRNASVLPVFFQWSSSGFPMVFQCVPIMQINTGSPLEHHWVLASASVVPVASQCTCDSSGLPVCSNYAN